MYYQPPEANGYQSPSGFPERSQRDSDASSYLPPLSTASFDHQHTEQLLNSKLQAERLLLGMARLQDVLQDLEVRGEGVYTKVPLRQGTRFGPYSIAELTSEKTAVDWDVSKIVLNLFNLHQSIYIFKKWSKVNDFVKWNMCYN